MTSVYFDRKLKELDNPTQDQIDQLEREAKHYGYTLDWDKRFAYATEIRCGWREDMMKRRKQRNIGFGGNRYCF